MNASAQHSDLSLLSSQATHTAATGPSFAAALCGFLSTTVATTMVMFLPQQPLIERRGYGATNQNRRRENSMSALPTLWSPWGRAGTRLQGGSIRGGAAGSRSADETG